MNETLVTKPLAASGYATAAVGKWHLGMSYWGNLPLQRGFDSFFGFLAGAQDYVRAVAFQSVALGL